MTEAGKARIAASRKKKKAAELARRLAEMEKRAAANIGPSWRQRRLAEYTGRVLAVRGQARVDFMDAHPIAELFR